MAQAYPSRPARIVFICFQPLANEVLGEMLVSVVCTNRSEAFFCPACGELWGRRVDTYCQEWHPVSWYVRERPCHLHGDGSLLLDTDPVVALPRELMLRELRLATTRSYHA